MMTASGDVIQWVVHVIYAKMQGSLALVVGARVAGPSIKLWVPVMLCIAVASLAGLAASVPVAISIGTRSPLSTTSHPTHFASFSFDITARFGV